METKKIKLVKILYLLPLFILIQIGVVFGNTLSQSFTSLETCNKALELNNKYFPSVTRSDCFEETTGLYHYYSCSSGAACNIGISMNNINEPENTEIVQTIERDNPYAKHFSSSYLLKLDRFMEVLRGKYNEYGENKYKLYLNKLLGKLKQIKESYSDNTKVLNLISYLEYEVQEEYKSRGYEEEKDVTIPQVQIPSLPGIPEINIPKINIPSLPDGNISKISNPIISNSNKVSVDDRYDEGYNDGYSAASAGNSNKVSIDDRYDEGYNDGYSVASAGNHTPGLGNYVLPSGELGDLGAQLSSQEGASIALYKCTKFGDTVIGARSECVSYTNPSLLGYIWETAGSDRKALYRCEIPTEEVGIKNYFTSFDSSCNGEEVDKLLGYVYDTNTVNTIMAKVTNQGGDIYGGNTFSGGDNTGGNNNGGCAFTPMTGYIDANGDPCTPNYTDNNTTTDANKSITTSTTNTSTTSYTPFTPIGNLDATTCSKGKYYVKVKKPEKFYDGTTRDVYIKLKIEDEDRCTGETNSNFNMYDCSGGDNNIIYNYAGTTTIYKKLGEKIYCDTSEYDCDNPYELNSGLKSESYSSAYFSNDTGVYINGEPYMCAASNKLILQTTTVRRDYGCNAGIYDYLAGNNGRFEEGIKNKFTFNSGKDWSEDNPNSYVDFRLRHWIPNDTYYPTKLWVTDGGSLKAVTKVYQCLNGVFEYFPGCASFKTLGSYTTKKYCSYGITSKDIATQTIHRLLNSTSHDHMVITDANYKNGLPSGYHYEASIDIAKVANDSLGATKLIYRCYSSVEGDHKIGIGGCDSYTSEGTYGYAWDSSGDGRMELYRCWREKPNGKKDHFTSVGSCYGYNGGSLGAWVYYKGQIY